MQRSAQIFDQLCHASSELNKIFSVPVLITLTSNLITVTGCAFLFFSSMANTSNRVLKEVRPFLVFFFFTNWTRILVVLTAADLPVTNVRYFY